MLYLERGYINSLDSFGYEAMRLASQSLQQLLSKSKLSG